jgi:hypothetical protein
MRARLRRAIPALAAIILVATLYSVAQAQVAAGSADAAAKGFMLRQEALAMPPGYASQKMQTVRKVNPAYFRIRSWISSVGAGIAINDLVGHDRSDGMCIVDTRTNEVVVTYTPTAPKADRFTPFVLDAKPLAMNDSMAPMACVPGDYNGDGRMDVLVYYWGRTPVIFSNDGRSGLLSRASYLASDVLSGSDDTPGESAWNTNAVTVGDFDGDGHPDLIFGNYFPTGGVLDPASHTDVVMNDSLSNARNGGGEQVLRWVGNDSSGAPRYQVEENAVPRSAQGGWTLALANADLTGDLLPDVYIANDFGHDHLLYNRSTRGHIGFSEAIGSRSPTTPKSFQLGRDSFKSMGADFVDLNGNGRFDILVSNITTSFALEESNFFWQNEAHNPAAMQHDLAAGNAPFSQQAEQKGLAWTGWGWDIKGADMLNSGSMDVLQTAGFVLGKAGSSRWAWLQEMATSNDDLLQNPHMWPNAQPGDDISGQQRMAFYVPDGSGKYVDIASQLGISSTLPTRGIAIADTTGTGALDFAVAQQYGPPEFFRNTSPALGHALDLHLKRPVPGTGRATPAYDATVTITRADGSTSIGALDGGSGHSGKNDFDVHFGLGSSTQPVRATITWRATDGTVHRQQVTVSPGTHTFSLDTTTTEVS